MIAGYQNHGPFVLVVSAKGRVFAAELLTTFSETFPAAYGTIPQAIHVRNLDGYVRLRINGIATDLGSDDIQSLVPAIVWPKSAKEKRWVEYAVNKVDPQITYADCEGFIKRFITLGNSVLGPTNCPYVCFSPELFIKEFLRFACKGNDRFRKSMDARWPAYIDALVKNPQMREEAKKLYRQRMRSVSEKKYYQP